MAFGLETIFNAAANVRQGNFSAYTTVTAWTLAIDNLKRLNGEGLLAPALSTAVSKIGLFIAQDPVRWERIERHSPEMVLTLTKMHPAPIDYFMKKNKIS
jgi:hypothetical protein